MLKKYGAVGAVGLFIGLFFLLPAVYVTATEVGGELDSNTPTTTSSDSETDTTQKDVSKPAVPSKPIHNSAAVEQAVRTFFADTPIMAEIARCESKFRQFTDSGNVLRGGYGNNMIGVFQFNEPVHAKAAKSLGLDINTLDGNLGYAKHLYLQSGTDPWVSSLTCWNVPTKTAKTKTTAAEFTDLVFGQADPRVRELQQDLNAAGFVIVSTGPGSPGQETTMFGSLTRDALRRFQCAEKIACSGSEYATGYGLYNEKTHEALQAYTPKKTAKTNTNPLSAEQRASILAQIAELTELVLELQKALARMRA